MNQEASNILIITSSFPESNEGASAAGSFVLDFALALSTSVNITILSPGSANYEKKIHGLSIVYFKCPKLPLSQLRIYNPLHAYYIMQTMSRGKSKLTEIIINHNFQHILAFWVIPCGYWAYLAYKKYRIPYSCWALGSDIWAYRKNFISRHLLTKILRNSLSNFADGYILKNEVQLISKRNCIFLPSTRSITSLCDNKFTDDTTKKRLVYIGRWHPNKGIDILLDALQLLGDDDWEQISEIYIAGGGPLEKVVHEKCIFLQDNCRKVTVSSYLNKQQAIEQIQKSDYLIIPSRIESIPVILSDAIQCDTAIIATPVGDIPKIISQYKIGILASEVTSTSLASAIISAINKDPNYYNSGINKAKSLFSTTRSTNIFLDSIKN